MTKCPNCSTKNLNEAHRCVNCGEVLTPTPLDSMLKDASMFFQIFLGPGTGIG